MSAHLSLPQYFSIGFALIVLGRTIHYLTVTRYLRERALTATVGRSSIRDWNEWAAYKKAHLVDRQPLTWWYVVWTIQIILFFWLVGWIAYGAGALKISTPSHLAQATSDIGGYTTVFDVAESGYRQWPFAAFGLIFVAVGFALPTLIRIGVSGSRPLGCKNGFHVSSLASRYCGP